jgi:hypothetical protein
MPTPFMHLQTAERIRMALTASDVAHGRLLRLLQQEWPAFYLGNIAPDFQNICDVAREATHFHRLPPDPDEQAYQVMLAHYPELANATALPPDRAVFVAGYNAHLLLDLLWFREILMPYFVEVEGLGDFHQRRLVHHTLLMYLDKVAFNALPATAEETLAAAQPRQWLPFADDTHLMSWRNMVAAQLRPGAAIRTIEIYAGRLKMPPAELAATLQDPLWLETHLFNKVPVAEVQAKLEAAIPQSIALIQAYLKT